MAYAKAQQELWARIALRLVSAQTRPSFVQKYIDRKERAQTGHLVFKLFGFAFAAWRSVTALKRRKSQLDMLTGSIPYWIARVGDRRRRERAWLGWRLAMVQSNTQQQPQLVHTSIHTEVEEHATQLPQYDK